METSTSKVEVWWRFDGSLMEVWWNFGGIFDLCSKSLHFG